MVYLEPIFRIVANFAYVYGSIAGVVTDVVDQCHQVGQSVRRVGRFGHQSDRLRPLINVRFEHQ